MARANGVSTGTANTSPRRPSIPSGGRTGWRAWCAAGCWMRRPITASPTPTAGRAIARLAEPGDLIALVGELGAGKTQMVRGIAAGLGIEPADVHIGTEECAHCSMMISDRRFATQVLNTKGRSWKFDSIECLRAFVHAGTLGRDELHSAWVTDGNDETWVRAETAAFLRSDAVRSPMGGGLLAFAAVSAAHAASEDAGDGTVMSWPEVLAAAPSSGSSVGSH